MQILFLTLEEVLELHEDRIARHGGRRGIRELPLLQSALAMPEAGTREGYVHADLHEMAATYLFHLVRNHPFIDGNKRVGAAAALVFLRLNGVTVHMSNAHLVDLVLSIAEGRASKSAIAAELRRHSVD